MHLINIRSLVINLSLIAAAFCSAALVLPTAANGFFETEDVELNGYAWSSTIGWISMGNGGIEQVTINTDGTVTGWAWSENIGWVRFGGLSNFPTGNGTYAQNATLIDVGGGNYELRGWARACAGTATGDCSTMTSRSDGWDGWIALTGETLTGDRYSTQFNASGPVTYSYAWGGTVVGWVDMFSSVTFDVLATADLTITGCTVLAGADSCNGSVSWQFTNATNPTVVRTAPSASTIFSSTDANAVGNQNPYTMTLGTNTFEARDDSGLLDVGTVSITNGLIQCTANASPVGGVCVCGSGFNDSDSNGTCEADAATPTTPIVNDFTITPPIVRKGQDVTVTWDTTATSCTVTTTQGNNITGGGTGTTDITITASNQVIVTLTCDGFQFGQETVRVIPTIFES